MVSIDAMTEPQHSTRWMPASGHVGAAQGVTRDIPYGHSKVRSKRGRTALKSFFTPKEIRELVDITYRQIQYWDKSRFIIPSYRRRGKYRLYTFGDLVLLKVAELLRKHGNSIQQLRTTISGLREMLREITFPFSELNILFRKEQILLFNGDVVMNVNDRDTIIFSVPDLRRRLVALHADEEEAA